MAEESGRERRRHARIRLSRDVEVTELSTGRKMMGRMTSVSTGGVSITLDVYLPLGKKVAVSFKIREGADYKDLVAKVLTVKDLTDGFAAGLEFIDIPAEVAASLESVVNDVFAMRELKLFAGLTHEEALALRSICKELKFKEHEAIFTEGSESDSFYAVAKGKVSITKKSNIEGNKEEILELIREHEFFGEMALFKGKSTATAKAHMDCVLFRLTVDDFNKLYEQNHKLATKLLVEFIKALSRRIKSMNQELVDILYPDGMKEIGLGLPKNENK